MSSSDRALRVLLLNHADVGYGGAAVAGFRLHRSLLAAGVDSTLLVGTKASSEPTVGVLRTHPVVRRPLAKLGYEVGLNGLEGMAAYGLLRSPKIAEADVIHAHAVWGSWFSYPALAPLSRRTPVVHTLHDMWTFTGHCSFSFECERWRTGCGHCPHLEVAPPVRRDATAVEWRLKDALWSHSRLVIISPSRWLAELAEQSMLSRFEVRVIPHGIDTDEFAPRPREASRAALGLAPDRTAVLFASASLQGGAGIDASDRKGVDLLLGALRAVPPALRATCTLLLMGGGGQAMATVLRAEGYEVIDVGYVVSDPLKSFVYSAADVFVFPTRADNAPLVVLESLACGTPVASFDVGGLAEMIEPGTTGTLAPAGDVTHLTADLVALLEDPVRLSAMRPACRTLVETEHPAALAAARHIALYRELAG
ncbi:MAG TPA: glycosyltransferase [Acidimicrobiales bacterium]|nr:glycosyltransferase [Acidimicrobiales bacterium]